MRNQFHAWKVPFLLCSLHYLFQLVAAEVLVPPISGAINDAITDGSAVYLSSGNTVRRYDPDAELPAWTRIFPGPRTNIGFDEEGNIAVTNLNASVFLPVTAKIEVVETSTGNTSVNATHPFVDVEEGRPRNFKEFVVVGGNLTGVFRRLHYRDPITFVSFPARRLFTFRIQTFVDTAYTGTGTRFVVAFWNGTDLTLGIEEPADPWWWFKNHSFPVGGPLSTSTNAEMVVDTNSDALYLAGFPKRPSDTLFVYGFNLSTFEQLWMHEVDTPRKTDGGIGLAIREGGGQVVVASVGGENGTPGDVMITALDSASGTFVWNATLETPREDRVHSVHSLHNGTIAVVGELNQDGEGNATPIYFLAGKRCP